MSLLRGAFAVMLASAIAVACGSDDDDDGGKPSSKGGASGKGGMAAAGEAGDGTGGTGATGAKGGKGGGGKGGKGGTTGGASGTGNPGGTGGSGGTTGGMGASGGAAGGLPCTTLVSWDSGRQTEGFSYSDPGWLQANSGVYWDEEGDPSGSIRIEVPFTAEDQNIGLSVYPSILNLSGWSISLRVKLRSGLTDDDEHPGSAKLVALSGLNNVYAAGEPVALDSDDWVTLTLEPDRPDYVDDSVAAFNPTDVRQIAMELSTGSDTGTTYGAAVLLVDTLTVCEVPGGTGGAGGMGGSGGRGGAGGAGVGGASAGSSGAGSGGELNLGGMGGEGGV